MGDGTKRLPDDMPADQREACLAGRMCGARLRQITGDGHRYCRQKPVLGQVGGFPHRCKLHGGCTGAKPGNTNSLKHGIYSESLLEGEQAVYDSITVGDLTHEIKITKIRLRRALKAEREQQLKLASPDAREQQRALSLESTDSDSERVGDGEAKVTKTRVVRRATDFGEVINRLVNQLVKLEGQRVLMGGGEGLDADEQARLARLALDALNRELDAEERDEHPV